MNSSPRQHHNGSAPAHCLRRCRRLLVSVAAVSVLTGCSPSNPPTMVRTTVTAHAPTRAAANAGANDTAPQPVTASPPTAAATGLLDGIPTAPKRQRQGDYRRAAFGDTWTDDQDAPGGHNGCDTRNDILNRDLVDKTYTSISRCPNAVAGGTLHDPYTGTDIAFTRGNQIGASVQIDHIVPLAYAWDMGARDWTPEMRTRFANDPANLLAVEGKSNQAKSDKEPAKWMPANTAYRCQYVSRFAGVLRAYRLPIDAPSAAVVTKAAATCPPS
ncbi:HNH endonuclease family protein [Mycolicibacterium llatzerense]|uniref:HNH endonuclease family protein n=1 Tax=Mycolicibacterium llatzerense TaxID=280871 RepID=UPI001F296CB0|nr:HNH endonuclease family protein [Mycolicibacterium llatzerense]